MRRIVSALLLLVASSSVAADFAAGLEAYLRGDYATALREFRPLAEQGDAEAQTVLGLMYANGEGVPEDARQAEYWWRKAAAQGLAEAQFNLGSMYANGESIPEDDIQAAYWWRKAAEQGFAEAQFNLGNMYAKGEGVPEDDVQAAYWWRKAAEQGVAAAQFNLGYRYAKGEGVPEDDRQAVFWYRKAAEQGLAEAQFNLGNRYAKGEGVPEDDRQAVYWYRKAAEQGLAEAQLNLGNRYAKGEGVPEDDIQAVYWYRQAAEQGHAKAQFNLGLMYDNGEGVPEDDRQAVFWYRKAAGQGDAKAQGLLGFMYANGRGVPEDDRQAVFWYRKAVGQGYATAQFNLGVSYAKGEGVPQDDIHAYAWFNLAGAQGFQKAEQARTYIRQRMTPTQIAEAQKLSRELAARVAEDRGESAPALVFGNPVPPPEPSRNTVRQVQAYLALLGYDSGPVVDELPGRRTTAAVRRFQQDLGMTPTGRISDELLVLLKAAAAARRQEPAEPVSSGSGFLVSRDGEVVTNHHVVDGCARVTVNRAGASHDATVRAVDADDDLALIKAPPGTGEAATLSESPRASLGEAVTVAGYPLHGLLSRELNVTSGNVSALAGPGDDAKRLQITAPVQQGNSGGPLLDGAGNVIGVVVSKLDAVRAAKLTGDIPQNVNFAIKGALVRGFLDIHGVAYRRRPSNAKLPPERLAELARSFTVAVHCWE